MSIQTTNDNDARAKPGWNGPSGTARESYSLEIDHETRQDLFEKYDENSVETDLKKFDNLEFHDAYSGDETVRVIEGDNAYLHYSRPKGSEAAPEDELLGPLLEATGTSKKEFESMLE